MGLQKYRADSAGEPYPNGAVPWFTEWMGGPTLALFRDCPTPFGPRTVYVTGEADTYFSLPAACQFRGRAVRGWVGFDENGPEFYPDRDSWVYPHVG